MFGHFGAKVFPIIDTNANNDVYDDFNNFSEKVLRCGKMAPLVVRPRVVPTIR